MNILKEKKECLYVPDGIRLEHMVFVILTLGSLSFPLHADKKQTTPERDRICFRQCLSTFPARLHSNV